MANDQFPADYVGKREITHVTDSQQGAIVKISADGKSLLYQPKKGFFGSDQLTYTVDGTQVASVSVYVWRPFQDAWSSVYQFTGDNVLDPMQLDNGYRLTQLSGISRRQEDYGSGNAQSWRHGGDQRRWQARALHTGS